VDAAHGGGDVGGDRSRGGFEVAGRGRGGGASRPPLPRPATGCRGPSRGRSGDPPSGVEPGLRRVGRVGARDGSLCAPALRRPFPSGAWSTCAPHSFLGLSMAGNRSTHAARGARLLGARVGLRGGPGTRAPASGGVLRIARPAPRRSSDLETCLLRRLLAQYLLRENGRWPRDDPGGPRRAPPLSLRSFPGDLGNSRPGRGSRRVPGWGGSPRRRDGQRRWAPRPLRPRGGWGRSLHPPFLRSHSRPHGVPLRSDLPYRDSRAASSLCSVPTRKGMPSSGGSWRRPASRIR
jgi:hypothetical protein